MAIQGFFTGDVKIRDLNGVLKAVNGIVEVATDAGTVTSVGLTVGSTGTDVNVANSPITTNGSITLNLPTASATNRGLLSSADWAIFSAKQGTITLTTTGNNGSATLISGTLNIPTYTLAGLGGISLTSLSASSPLLYNNTTGAFSIQVANGSQNGYLSSSDWTTFNSKQSALTFSSPLVNTSGTISIPAASGSVNGYLTSTDWTTFNNKQGAITLTTTGSSGAATLIGTTLNIPNYSGALTGYVPYTGATGNVDLGEYGLDTGFLNFDITPTGTPITQGTVYWDDSRSTLSLIMNGVTQHIGQDSFFYVKNSTGSSIPKGTSVRFNGTDGASGHLLIAPFLANGTYPSSYFMGVTAETIGNGGFGQVVNFGELEGIDTSAYTAGDLLYASSTVSGGFQTTAPSAPNNIVLIAAALNSKNNGAIVVRPTYGSNINDDEGVLITSAANNQGLFYDSATGLWKNKSIATVLGYTPANAATTLTINGTTYDLSANRTWNVGTVTSVGTSGPLTGGTITGSGTIGITQSTTSTDGYLSSTDWNTFNNKQPAGSYITALAGEATASGPGSATVTLSTSAVTGKLLTGLNLTGGGTIAATDSILQAFGKVQNQISGMVGGVTFQGTWDASTNTPTLTSSVGTKGYYYIVDVAGSTNLNGITDWKIGDWAIFNGTTWDKVDNTDAVSSVNGFTGAVSLTTSNIAEGTNLYYLDSRARLALSFTAGSGAYDNTTGVITIPTNTSQLTNGANYITLSSLSASSPLSYNSGTGAFSIQVANGSQNGYLSSSDWTTFNSKQNAITLTTTGSSGSSTLVGATLNVPTYTLSGLGGVPTSRQLTINGTAYDLSADRSWSVGTVTSIATSGPLTGGTITGSGTIGITQATTSTDGYLSSTDWNTFNSKQNALTNPVTGTGTTNYLSKFTGTSTIGNSLVYDNGTNVIIGNGSTDIQGRLQVTTSSGALLLNTDNSNFALLFRNTASSNKLWDISTVNNDLAFNEGGVGTRLYMQAGGNIGIGTITPTFLLDVNGTLRASANVTGTDNVAVFHNTNTTTSGTPVIALSTASTGPDAPADIRLSGTNTKGIRIYAADTTLTSTPLGAGFQMFSVSSTNFPGQMFFDSGANNSAFIAFRTAVTSGTISERMRITANGNISIGNTNDTFKLDVSGTLRATGAATFSSSVTSNSNTNGQIAISPSTNTNAAAFVASNAGGGCYFGKNNSTGGAFTGTAYATVVYSGGDVPMSFYTNDTERMRITSGGNVGIGTTSPTFKLEVNGGSGDYNALRIYTSGHAYALIESTTGARQAIVEYKSPTRTYSSGLGTDGSYFFYDATAGSERMRITSGGNVGIGTSSPTARLDLGNNVGSANTANQIALYSLSGTALYGFGVSAAQLNYISGGNHSFYNSATTSVQMTITSAGNVGIGTTSPSQRLTIAQTNGYPIIDFYNSGTGFGDIGYNAGTTSFNLGSYSTTPLAFYTNGSERMRISSGGNVGIGTTSPNAKLDLGTGYGANGEKFLIYNDNTTSALAGTKMGFYIDRFGESNSVTFLFPYAAGTTSRYHVAYKDTNNTTITDVCYVTHNSTSWSFPSDERLKNVEGVIPDAINKIKELKAVYYTQKRDNQNKRKVGLLAQDLLKVLPEVVDVPDTELDKDGNQRYMSVALADTIPLLVKAIQELKQELDTLKNK
jgi:predicted heme/steroid binding protein